MRIQSFTVHGLLLKTIALRRVNCVVENNNGTKYLLVEAEVLPEVFLRVVEAKELLATGRAKSASQAAQMVDISRSAFYKYKDSIFAYSKNISDNMLALTATLSDEAGVLSKFITELYAAGFNVLTVNQNIPVDGVALVSISGRSNELKLDTKELIDHLKGVHGVVDVKIISGR